MEVTATQALDLATQTAERLEATALWHGDRCLWLGDEMEVSGDGYEVVHRDCDGSFYDGTAGIGWFLAHAHSRTEDPRAARTARGALEHALDWAEHRCESPTLYDGAAGVGWAVHEAAAILGDTVLIARGADLFQRALSRVRAMDLSNELIAGRAGLVLAALSTPDDRFADEALRLGELMLEHEARSRCRTGAGSPQPDWCGLGHGQSGPALAFAELARLTGSEQYVQAARAAVGYERGWLTGDGWPDLREFDRAALQEGVHPASPAMWCHGSVGVGLARLQAWDALGDPALLADATLALHVASRAVGELTRAEPGGYAANFSLCHGAGGLVELFSLAATTLDDRSWRSAAGAVLAVEIAQRGAGHGWRCGIEGGTEVPGLMLGLAGFGTAFLRLAEPASTSHVMTSPLLMSPLRRRMLPR